MKKLPRRPATGGLQAAPLGYAPAIRIEIEWLADYSSSGFYRTLVVRIDEDASKAACPCSACAVRDVLNENRASFQCRVGT